MLCCLTSKNDMVLFCSRYPYYIAPFASLLASYISFLFTTKASLLHISVSCLRQKEKYFNKCHLTKVGNLAADEKKSRSTVIIRIFVILITMCVLAWATYTGFRLATEPQRDGKYYPLAFPIGVVTILFGLVYGIIGLGIVGDLAICLIAQLMPKERKGIIIHQDRSNTDDKSVV